MAVIKLTYYKCIILAFSHCPIICFSEINNDFRRQEYNAATCSATGMVTICLSQVRYICPFIRVIRSVFNINV